MYELHETLFNKLDSFGIPYTDNQKSFNNLVKSDFESIVVEVENFMHTQKTTMIRYHAPTSVSISSNFKKEPVFNCDPNPRDSVPSLIDALEKLATQTEAQMLTNFLQNETAKQSWPACISEAFKNFAVTVLLSKQTITLDSSIQFLQK